MTIALTPEQELILSHLHVNFDEVENVELIDKAISIAGGIDWYWHYSDDGNTLRNGEKRINDSIERLKEIESEIGDDPGISALVNFVPKEHGQTMMDLVDLHWPWYRAYNYSKRVSKTNPSSLIELSLNGRLEEYIEKSETLKAVVADLVSSITDPVYDNTVLNNDRVDVIAASVALPPVRAFKHIWTCYPITTSQKLYKKASHLADLAEEVFAIEKEAVGNKCRPSSIQFSSIHGKGYFVFEQTYSNNTNNLLFLRVKTEKTNYVIPVMSIPR